jgi:hypothetical protein
MLGFFKLALFGYLALTVFYWLLSIYFRSVERERLEKDYDDGGVAGDRDAFIAQGLAAFDRSLKRKLVLLVYIVPTVVVAALVWILNFQ